MRPVLLRIPMEQVGAAIGRPRLPPWLPLWGSCHEVTERENVPFPPLRGTSPIGRGKGAANGRQRLPLLTKGGAPRSELEY